MISYSLHPPKKQVLFAIIILLLAVSGIFITNISYKWIIILLVLIIGSINIFKYYYYYPQEIIIYQNNILWKYKGIVYTPNCLPIISDHYISIKKNYWQWWLITSENIPNISFNDIQRNFNRYQNKTT